MSLDAGPHSSNSLPEDFSTRMRLVAMKGGSPLPIPPLELREEETAVIGRAPGEVEGKSLAIGSWDVSVSISHARVRREGGRLIVRKHEKASRGVFARKGRLEEEALVIEDGGGFCLHRDSPLWFRWERLAEASIDWLPASPMRLEEMQGAYLSRWLRELCYDFPLILTASSQEKLFRSICRFIAEDGPMGIAGLVAWMLAVDEDGRLIDVLGCSHSAPPDISRTVLRTALAGPRERWGARYYQKRKDSLSASASDVSQPSLRQGYEWLMASPVGIWKSSVPELPSDSLIQPLRERTGDSGEYFHPATIRLGEGGEQGYLVLYLHCPETDQALDPGTVAAFLQLVGTITAAHLESAKREQQAARYGRFLSGPIRDLLDAGRLDSLAPQDNQLCTLLFCDRKGSSRDAEQLSRLKALEVQRELLEISAGGIDAADGTIIDFAGDGVLALWGWPSGEGDSGHAWGALQAALDIIEKAAERRERFAAFPFRIGIHTGEVAVGNIGWQNQAKIGAFGPEVNKAARVENLAKDAGVPLVLTEHAVASLKASAGAEMPLLRRLGAMKLRGMEARVVLYEVVLKREKGGGGFDAEQVALYHRALEHFEQGRWSEALAAVRAVGRDEDRLCRVLERYAQAFLAGEIPPPAPGWNKELNALPNYEAWFPL